MNSNMGPENGSHGSLHFKQPPRRVVSLVPSLTESMFDLGLGSAVIAVTQYCMHPAQATRQLPKIGGTKNPHISAILKLRPDLVLANREENTRQAVQALEEAGLRVWVTHPQTVRGALDVLWTLVGIFRDKNAAARLETLEQAVELALAAASGFGPIRYFCPIWFEDSRTYGPWWMTFNRSTYCSDLLTVVGGLNVFAMRERRYPLAADLGLEDAQGPGERDTRYPRLPVNEIREAQPELILLPDEPYPFQQSHRQQIETLFADTPAVQQGRVYLIDGSLITWHGTRMGRALQTIPSILHNETE